MWLVSSYGFSLLGRLVAIAFPVFGYQFPNQFFRPPLVWYKASRFPRNVGLVAILCICSFCASIGMRYCSCWYCFLGQHILRLLHRDHPSL